MSEERRVWIAQCLCPQRHAILAAADEADSRAEAEKIATSLREGVAALLQSGELSPRCGLCHSSAESWRYELGRTRFRSMAEAMPELKREEAKNAMTRALWGDMRRSD